MEDGRPARLSRVPAKTGGTPILNYLLPAVPPMYPSLGLFMKFFDFLKTVKYPEHRLAWLVAIVVDAIQIVAMPLFVAGGLSPVDVVLDAVAAVVLIELLGWHWAFLPTIAAELVPGFDLFPTWTAAVFFVTRQRVHSGEPEILPPGPAPARRS